MPFRVVLQVSTAVAVACQGQGNAAATRLFVCMGQLHPFAASNIMPFRVVLQVFAAVAVACQGQGTAGARVCCSRAALGGVGTPTSSSKQRTW
jgi:hypothetical protein